MPKRRRKADDFLPDASEALGVGQGDLDVPFDQGTEPDVPEPAGPPADALPPSPESALAPSPGAGLADLGTALAGPQAQALPPEPAGLEGLDLSGLDQLEPPNPQDMQIEELTAALEDPMTPAEDKAAIQQMLQMAGRRMLAGI